MGNSFASVLPNTREREQQRMKEDNDTDEDCKMRGVSMEKVKRARQQSRQPITT